MKKLLLILIITLSLTKGVKAQTSAKLNAVSLTMARQQMEADRFVDSVVTHTSMANFSDFLYEIYTAKKLECFAQLYNYFLQEKYNEWIKKKKQ